MSSTEAREQPGEPTVPEQAAPSGARQRVPEVAPPRRGPAASGAAVSGPALTGHRRRRRAWIAAVGVVVVVAAGVAGAGAAGVFRTAKPTGGSSGYSTKTYTVTQRSLTSQSQENATLGDAGTYTVVVPGSASGSGGTGSPPSSSGPGSGTFTWLPAAGQTIRQGQVIYKVSETPVVLLYGSVPAYRDLSEGMTGGDVLELNTDLVKLGFATAAAMGPHSGWDYFSGETAYALELLQSHLGLTETGSLPLGQAVFLPSAIQVTGLGTGAVAGGPAAAGSTVLTASSLTPVVTIDLYASLQTEVKAGDKVSIALPDGATTPGVISQISTVASSSSSSSSSSGGSSPSDNGQSQGGSSGPATITVLVSLTDPKAAGNLNQAPVEVTITTGSVSNALVVPVDALLAQSGGGYAVEVTGPGGHHLVQVTPGLFDDAAGLVQVTSTSLTPGQHVVVPGI